MSDLQTSTPAPRRRIPMPVKVAYTAFVAILVPTYLWFYGPTNFLYFCDQSLLIALAGIWLESALLVAMCAVGLVAPQLLWVLDFAGTAVGRPITGMTAYMFDGSTSLFLRGLSGFHGWLPFLLIYLVGRLGYDRRALPTWTSLAVVTLLVCFFLMPPPNPDAGLGVARGPRGRPADPAVPPDAPRPAPLDAGGRLSDAAETQHLHDVPDPAPQDEGEGADEPSAAPGSSVITVSVAASMAERE